MNKYKKTDSDLRKQAKGIYVYQIKWQINQIITVEWTYLYEQGSEC